MRTGLMHAFAEFHRCMAGNGSSAASTLRRKKGQSPAVCIGEELITHMLIQLAVQHIMEAFLERQVKIFFDTRPHGFQNGLGFR